MIASLILAIVAVLWFLLVRFKQMLGLSILIKVSLCLFASIAAHTTLKVVVLAVAANPATVREVESFLGCLKGLGIGRVAVLLSSIHPLLLALLLLVLSPLGSASVVLLLWGQVAARVTTT